MISAFSALSFYVPYPRATGGVEEQEVEIRSRDLSSPRDFPTLARFRSPIRPSPDVSRTWKRNQYKSSKPRADRNLRDPCVLDSFTLIENPTVNSKTSIRCQLTNNETNAIRQGDVRSTDTLKGEGKGIINPITKSYMANASCVHGPQNHI